MAVFRNGLYKLLLEKNWARCKFFLQQRSVIFNDYFLTENLEIIGNVKYLSENKEHDNKYTYEVSRDPKEWEFVEKLMPLETVPVPKPKPNYPSGWRPPKDEALQHPYFVERSKNHMLSVYLNVYNRGQLKVTKVVKIHGDLWKLHNELKAHIEEVKKKKIASFVTEGSNVICFRGDHVYYVEQWLLNKGF